MAIYDENNAENIAKMQLMTYVSLAHRASQIKKM